MPESIKILIADDHPIFRQGIIKIVEQDHTYEIVAQCGDGNEVIEKIKELNPAIAIIDISMPGMSGLEVLRAAQKERFATEFIILTMYKDEEYFNEAMNLGVKGYILKDNAAKDLLNCLRTVSQGSHFICPELSNLLLERNAKMQSLLYKTPTLKDLTPTERKILKLIGQNKTSKEIAKELFVSIRTIQNHRNNIAQKLGLKGHHKLLQFAIENKSYL
jgi:DNA-binding NarL/FixJ family response regulator